MYYYIQNKMINLTIIIVKNMHLADATAQCKTTMILSDQDLLTYSFTTLSDSVLTEKIK